MGNGCEVYSHDPADFYAGICLDPYYDDEDFTSGDMCCECPKQCAAENSSASASDYVTPGCEDWVSFDGENSSRESHSNLGGLGPQIHKPKEIRYYTVGWLKDFTPYDLVFLNGSEYVPKNTDHNKIDGSLATVNILSGQMVKLKGEFVRNRTFCPVKPFKPKMTFCDIDHSKVGQEEEVKIDGISAFYIVDGDPEFEYTVTAVGSDFSQTMRTVSETFATRKSNRFAKKFTAQGGVKFGVAVKSTMFGTTCDNPRDPDNLTNVTCGNEVIDQAKRCFMVEFEDTSEFYLEFRAHFNGRIAKFGRNFALSGTSDFFAQDISNSCFTPTPSPTPAPASTPTASPTGSPTSSPTPSPTSAPTASPTDSPTNSPTPSPTADPTTSPTTSPTVAPTYAPTSARTSFPTTSPTTAPTTTPRPRAPTPAPTDKGSDKNDGNKPGPGGPDIPRPTPQPPVTTTTQGSNVKATGDPHLVNINGQRFDIMQPGAHVLLHIPWKSRAFHTLLHVEATAAKMGGACADIYFQTLNVTGKWADAKLHARDGDAGPKGFSYSAQTSATFTSTPWMTFGKVLLKVTHGRTKHGADYLNFFARNLKSSGHLVGGLLGEDDHSAAATPSEVCRRSREI